MVGCRNPTGFLTRCNPALRRRRHVKFSRPFRAGTCRADKAILRVCNSNSNTWPSILLAGLAAKGGLRGFGNTTLGVFPALVSGFGGV